jgi:hypothetical protein
MSRCADLHAACQRVPSILSCVVQAHTRSRSARLPGAARCLSRLRPLIHLRRALAGRVIHHPPCTPQPYTRRVHLSRTHAFYTSARARHRHTRTPRPHHKANAAAPQRSGGPARAVPGPRGPSRRGGAARFCGPSRPTAVKMQGPSPRLTLVRRNVRRDAHAHHLPVEAARHADAVPAPRAVVTPGMSGRRRESRRRLTRYVRAVHASAEV